MRLMEHTDILRPTWGCEGMGESVDYGFGIGNFPNLCLKSIVLVYSISNNTFQFPSHREERETVYTLRQLSLEIISILIIHEARS